MLGAFNKNSLHIDSHIHLFTSELWSISFSALIMGRSTQHFPSVYHLFFLKLIIVFRPHLLALKVSQTPILQKNVQIRFQKDPRPFQEPGLQPEPPSKSVSGESRQNVLFQPRTTDVVKLSLTFFWLSSFLFCMTVFS